MRILRSLTIAIATLTLTIPRVFAVIPSIDCGEVGALAQCGTTTEEVGKSVNTLIIPSVLSTIIGLLAFVAMGYLIKGGIDFIRAQGSPDKIKTAQKSMISAVVGLVIAMSAFILVQIVANLSLTP